MVVLNLRRPPEVGTKRIEGEAPVAETGTPFEKVTVMEVALLMTPEVLVTPEIITTTSLPLVGKFVPTISSVVVDATVTELTTGEEAYNCSYLQLVVTVFPQLYLPVPIWILMSSVL